MPCEKFEELWNATLDARQAPEENAELAAHAAQCRECAEMLSATDLLWQGLETREEPALPEDFAENVLAAFNRPAPLFSRQVRLMAALAVAAAILISVGIYVQSKPAGGPALPGEGTELANDDTIQQDQLIFDPHDVDELAPMLTSIPGLSEDYLAMFRQTGTAVALFPDQFRRVTDANESGMVVDRIRPVAQPVTAAFNALRKTLPGSTVEVPGTPEDAKSSLLLNPLESDLGFLPWS